MNHRTFLFFLLKLSANSFSSGQYNSGHPITDYIVRVLWVNRNYRPFLCVCVETNLTMRFSFSTFISVDYYLGLIVRSETAFYEHKGVGQISVYKPHIPSSVLDPFLIIPKTIASSIHPPIRDLKILESHSSLT